MDRLWNFIFKENGDFRWTSLAILSVIFFALAILSAEVFYGDWRCSFAECRINK